ncbi:unnamed protein product [Rotaria magnacalcarata]
MYYEDVLHSRRLLEEFHGYLRGFLQAKTMTPMPTQKMYRKMIGLALNPTLMTTPILTPMVYEMFKCFGINYENSSDIEKMKISDILAQELDSLYECLSESVHSMKFPRHSRDFMIYSDNLKEKQVCLIKCICSTLSPP